MKTFCGNVARALTLWSSSSTFLGGADGPTRTFVTPLDMPANPAVTVLVGSLSRELSHHNR